VTREAQVHQSSDILAIQYRDVHPDVFSCMHYIAGITSSGLESLAGSILIITAIPASVESPIK